MANTNPVAIADWAKYHAGEGDLPEGYGGESRGGGTGAYDQLLSSLPKTSDLATQVSTNENNAFKDYLGYLQKQPSSVDFYKTQLGEAGIPQLQKTASTLQQQIFDTEDALKRVEPDVAANSRNSIVTEAQRRGMVEARQRPLNENLNILGTSLGRVSSAIQQGKADILTLTGLNSQDQAKLVDAYKTKLQLASTQGDRQIQAVINDVSNTLNVTLQKIHRGEQVSDTEAANAFELLKLEKTAKYQMDQLKYETENAVKDNSKRYITLADGATLYDTQTGQIVSSNQKDFKDSGGASGGAIGSGGGGRVGNL